MEISRRNFLKSARSRSLRSRFFLESLRSRARRGPEPAAREGNRRSAKSLKFCLNADKPSKNCAVRKAKDKKDQYCSTCQLFQRIDGEGKKGTGKCMIMPANSVTASSWCQSWVQNPAIKA